MMRTLSLCATLAITATITACATPQEPAPQYRITSHYIGSGEVGQATRITLETRGLQLFGQLRQLGRHPHALVGVCGTAGQGQRKGQDGGAQAHSGFLDHGQTAITASARRMRLCLRSHRGPAATVALECAPAK